jgi:hypothetical protein
MDTLKIDLSKIPKDELKEQNVIKLLPITENKKIRAIIVFLISGFLIVV